MKVKYSIIPFIPVALAMVFLKLMGIFGVDGNGQFLGLNKMGIAYTVIGAAIGLFVICIIINIFDKKTAPVYPVHKNPIAGIFSVLSGIAVVSSSVTSFLNTTANSDNYYMTIATLVFSIPAAIAFFLMSKVHFVGRSTVSGVSMLFIFPSLWGCAELVSEFLVATRVSISSTDLTALFCYIFITLFLFSNSMVLSRIKGRNPVKGCFIYGLPAVALSLADGLYIMSTSFVEGIDYNQILIGAQFVIISLYALSFIVEMTVKSYTKNEVEIMDGLPDDTKQSNNGEENSYIDTGDYDDLVFYSKESDNDDESEEAIPDEYYNKVNDFDDFITGYDRNSATDDNNIRPEKENDSPSVPELITGNENNRSEEKAQVIDNVAEDKSKKSEPKEKLSEVDRLLQELDSKK